MPWHFGRALIVLTEPVGIEEITNQVFTHVSFWVQILNVPIMCMNTKTIKELDKAIRRVKEVATDITRACFGKYIRIRISIDITKPLIKFLYLKQEEDENDMDSKEQEGRENKANGEAKTKEILMLIKYERLPYFCYIYSQIGHQYRECVNYKNQLREEMAYEPWMKAPTMTEQLKQNKKKENIRPEHGKKSQSYSTMEVQDKKGNSETNE